MIGVVTMMIRFQKRGIEYYLSLKDILTVRRLRNIPLKEVYDLYKGKDIFWAVCVDRSKTDIEEVRSLYRDHVESIWERNIPKICAVTGFTPLEVIKLKKCDYLSSHSSALEDALIEDTSWLGDPTITKIATFKILEKALLVGDNIYIYSDLIGTFWRSEELLLRPNIDLKRIPKARSIILKLSSAELVDLAEKLLLKKDFETLEFLSTPRFNNYIMGALFSIKKGRGFDIFLEIINELPNSIQNDIVSDYRDFSEYFNAFSLEELLKFLDSPFIDNLNYRGLKNLGDIFFDLYSKKDQSEQEALDDTILNGRNKHVFERWAAIAFSEVKRYIYVNMPGRLIRHYLEIFIPDANVPELTAYLRDNKIDIAYIKNHEEYREYFQKVNLRVILSKLSIFIIDKYDKYVDVNLIDYILEHVQGDKGLEMLIKYVPFFESIKNLNNIVGLLKLQLLDGNPTVQEIENWFDEWIEKLLLYGVPYNEYIPDSFKESHPNFFLREDAPEEVKTWFYSIRSWSKRKKEYDEKILKPEFMKYLYGVDLRLLENETNIILDRNKPSFKISSTIIATFDYDTAFEIITKYGTYFHSNSFSDVAVRKLKEKELPLSKEELLELIIEGTYESILNRECYAYETMPQDFKDKYPDMFLDATAPEELKEMYYRRKLRLNYFDNHHELLKYFAHTNIAYGLEIDLRELTLIDRDADRIRENENKLLLSEMVETIQNKEIIEILLENLKDVYKTMNWQNLCELFETFKDVLNCWYSEEDMKIYREQIKIATNYFGNEKPVKGKDLKSLIKRLMTSNSSEINTFKAQILKSISNLDEPLKKFETIEQIFLKNNTPFIGKIFSVFQILHPNLEGFDFSESSIISPTLKHCRVPIRNTIIFADLVRASIGSNNRSLQKYIANLEKGDELFSKIGRREITFDSLSEEEKETLNIFQSHLETLWKNTESGRTNKGEFIKSSNLLENIHVLYNLFMTSPKSESLPDRITKMFFHFAGFDTLSSLKRYATDKINQRDAYNRRMSEKIFTIEKGDFVKGLGKIEYIPYLLQNGILSKEFLNTNATSDGTPLDTDVSRIVKTEGDIEEIIGNTISATYGPIWIILKNDDRFVLTRDKGPETPAKKISKIEVFLSDINNHFGIRTGFASSEIDCFYMEEYDPRLGFEITMNGFYIPVIDKKGKTIFTPKDYDEIRSKMEGLSHYGLDDYTFSKNLEIEEMRDLSSIMENNSLKITEKKEKILKKLASILKEFDLDLKTTLDGDLTSGTVELLDTGSTGRHTNDIDAGDFDFVMRLDNTFYLYPEKMNALSSRLLEILGKDATKAYMTTQNDLRLFGVEIDSEKFDIDLSFTQKTDKVTYSTEMALQDKLDTMRRVDEEKYKLALANIIFAKRLLKENGVYKSRRASGAQGGLGGVGIENWILQHGGSFIDAATSFLEASEGKSFSEFKDTYYIWDFGENHFSVRLGNYPHDNFVENNMDERGYEKMKEALKKYLNSLENNAKSL